MATVQLRQRPWLSRARRGRCALAPGRNLGGVEAGGGQDGAARPDQPRAGELPLRRGDRTTPVTAAVGHLERADGGDVAVPAFHLADHGAVPRGYVHGHVQPPRAALVEKDLSRSLVAGGEQGGGAQRGPGWSRGAGPKAPPAQARRDDRQRDG